MRGVDIKSVLTSASAESAEVAALEQEMASELAKEAGNRGQQEEEEEGALQAVRGMPSVTPAPSRQSDIDRCVCELFCSCTLHARRGFEGPARCGYAFRIVTAMCSISPAFFRRH